MYYMCGQDSALVKTSRIYNNDVVIIATYCWKPKVHVKLSTSYTRVNHALTRTYIPYYFIFYDCIATMFILDTLVGVDTN